MQNERIKGSWEEIPKLKAEMVGTFRISDLGLLTYYLSIKYSQKSGKITLRQSAYVDKLLERAGIAGCKVVHTPMETRLKLNKESSSPPADSTLFCSVVGNLHYLMHTRPEITFSVGYVRFMEKPTAEHFSAVKHLLR